MNFLGHLFFSNNDTELMYANIFGDFVKGKDLSMYPEKIQKGILLHRTIDDYIDHHPKVVELIHHLYGPLPKIAGIAVDLYFDHLLGQQWDNYSDIELTTFIQQFNDAPINRTEFPKNDFWQVIDRMKKGEWLKHSASDYGLRKSSEGVSKMISFPNVLHQAPEIFEDNKERIKLTFKEFMEDAIPFFNDYFAQN